MNNIVTDLGGRDEGVFMFTFEVILVRQGGALYFPILSMQTVPAPITHPSRGNAVRGRAMEAPTVRQVIIVII